MLTLGMAITTAAGGGLVVVAPPPAAAASAGPERIGATPLIPSRARAVGALAPTAAMRVTVTLRPSDPAGLARYAAAVSTPGNRLYRHYLRPAQFVARFGPSPAAISAVAARMRASGLHPGVVAANHLSIPVRGTADQLSRAFSTGFERYRLASGRVAYANTSPPLVDGDVQSVVGLDTLAVPQVEGRADALPFRAAAPARPRVLTGGPQPCFSATQTGLNYGDGAYTSDQLASAYGFSGLYAGGDLGAGQTIALYELEPYLPSDIAAYKSCYGITTSVSNVQVDNDTVTGAGEGEAALDIEDVIGLAPKADILVYEGPSTPSGDYDTYSAIISQDRATVVSTSWGECEADEGPIATVAENTLFEEAALQGQTVVAAAGDHGSEDCGDARLAVDDPASQPLVTGVGGTTLRPLGPPATETVWNQDGAGGGGVSSSWSMPAYQSGAPAALHVRNAGSSGAPCAAAAGTGGGYCREVPDVAADANPYDAYVIYYNGAWDAMAGTSAAAPLWAAFLALTNASATCDGTDVGFANPALYAIAGGAGYTSDFHDVTTGTNDVGDQHLGTYTAGAGYDMASGLGSPDGTALGVALCATGNRLVVASPGAPISTVGRAVSVAITVGAPANGAGLDYRAIGLPAGLSIDPTSGVISGTPAQTGVTDVVVTVEDAAGAVGSVSFVWTVDADGGSVPTPAPAPVFCTVRQLLGNRGFESGSAVPWRTTSRLVERGSRTEAAHSGRYLVRMHGGRTPTTETLSQTVTLPGSCRNDRFSLWLHVDTTERTTRPVDTLRVQVVDRSGRVRSTLATFTNRYARRGYRQVSWGLGAEAGATITLRFVVTETRRGGGATNFCIDDTSLRD